LNYCIIKASEDGILHVGLPDFWTCPFCGIQESTRRPFWPPIKRKGRLLVKWIRQKKKYSQSLD